MAKRKTTKKIEEPQEESQEEPQARSAAKLDASMKERMTDVKKYLDAQPKVMFYIPLGEREEEGAFDTVQINGYTIQVQKGVSMELPKPVADMLANKYRVQSEAGKAMLANRDDKVQDALT